MVIYVHEYIFSYYVTILQQPPTIQYCINVDNLKKKKATTNNPKAVLAFIQIKIYLSLSKWIVASYLNRICTLCLWSKRLIN